LLSFRAQIISQLPGFLFERHGDIQSFAAIGKKITDCLIKTAIVNLDGGVFDTLTCLFGKGSVNLR
jgi:hypothetical protein